jgi:hypothetical protein
MDIKEQIAALPKEPERPKILRPERSVGAESQWTVYQFNRAEAALARLALAREWIEAAHQSDCDLFTDDGMRSFYSCTCGRDALLKALEVPK